MKQTITILAFLAAVSFAPAQQFELGGIAYNVLSFTELTVEVVSLGDDHYTGAITIPQTVEYDGTTYTVTALGKSAFESCTEVTSLTLPTTVRSIGAYCFYNCNFTTLQLPDSLRSIGDHAFLYSHVGSIHLPACFEEYGDAAFWARNLTNITVDEANPYYRSIGGWLYSKDSLTLCIVPDGVSGVINVPSYVRHIGRQAFGFNSHATSVSLSEGLADIGDFAFNVCLAVNNIVIPSTVTHIGICPFSYCPQLTNLSIAPGNTHYVMDGLLLYSTEYDTLVSCHKSSATVTLNPNLKVLGGFENNIWVQNINIPMGVTDISDNCFSGCTFCSITLPAHMKSIGAYAFAENSHLTNVTMPETLTTMGEGAFAWCDGLTSIVIPDSLRIIPKEAFNSCPRLASITWGKMVEEIGYAAFWAMAATNLTLPPTLKKLNDLAFAACANNLRTVTIQGQLDTMGESVFRHANLDYIHFTGCTPPVATGEGPLYDIDHLSNILIPCGSLNAWLSDNYWGQFADKYREDCNGTDDSHSSDFVVYCLGGRIMVEGVDGEMVRIFDMMGREMEPFSSHVSPFTLPTGIYLVLIGDLSAHKVAVMQ